MRIKLKELLNVTEQAPQAPQAAPVQPSAQSAIGGQPPAAPSGNIEADAAPTPTDPSEYDFTRDFRAFEDSKNKAEAAAKKKLLDKMNKMMLNKKVIANASRGYGQPKTDYTIENIKKISVEFWYKDWVVIVQDENDKKFFLTPGVNIKIEGGSMAGNEPSAEEPTADQAPSEPPPTPEPAAPEPEAPAAEPAPEPPAPAAPDVSAPETPPVEPQASQGQPPAPQTPQQSTVPPPLKKKKKLKAPVPVAEEAVEDAEVLPNLLTKDNAQQALGRLFAEFTNNNRFDVKPWVTRARSSGQDEDGMYNEQYRLRIPIEILGKDFDQKEFALFVKTETHRSGGAGEPFSRGSVDIQPAGRTYIFHFNLSGGLDI